jgi:hypothetical protein
MEYARVLKTGAVSGAIYGVLQGIVSVLSYVFYRQQIIDMIRASLPSNVNIPMTMDQLADIGMISAIPGSVIGGIIAGVIFSAIFAVMYSELLGKDSKRKGLFLGVLLFAGILAGELAYPGLIGGIFMVQTKFILLAPLSAAFFFALAYLTGMFYDRFDPKRKTGERKAKK